MHKIYIFFLLIYIFTSFTGCALKPVDFLKNADYTKYKFIYVSPTNTVTSSSESVYTGYNGYVYGSTYTQQANPSDIIAGFFMKKNFLLVNEIRNPENTIIINYGQSGKRNIAGGLAYTL